MVYSSTVAPLGGGFIDVPAQPRGSMTSLAGGNRRAKQDAGTATREQTRIEFPENRENNSEVFKSSPEKPTFEQRVSWLISLLSTHR
jgi:hypothetical protein